MTRKQRESKTSIDNALTFLIVGVLFMWTAAIIFQILTH
jgi:hypothetical protein